MRCVRAVRGLCVIVLMAGSLPCLDAQTTATAQTMAKDAHPKFEVATIKPSDPADRSHRFEIHGRRIVIENHTVAEMIEMSYGVHARQIVNGPSWIETERFDAEGVPDGEVPPDVGQFQALVQSLLAERFGLKLHTEKREMARYALTVTKGGPKIEATKSAGGALPSVRAGGNTTSHSLQMENVSMGDLAKQLQGELDRPVVDETSLKGRYDFTLKWLRADAAPGAEDADNALPGIFTALQEQAGLKVEPSKVEHAERPSAN